MTKQPKDYTITKDAYGRYTCKFADEKYCQYSISSPRIGRETRKELEGRLYRQLLRTRTIAELHAKRG